MEVWSSGSDDEEVLRPAHGAIFARDAKPINGRCFMARSKCSRSSVYYSDSMSESSKSSSSSGGTCLSTKSSSGPTATNEKITREGAFNFPILQGFYFFI